MAQGADSEAMGVDGTGVPPFLNWPPEAVSSTKQEFSALDPL
jgi:hypothetical protein